MQHHLQNWYFAFQVVFVLLVTAVGSSLFLTATRLVNRPMEVFTLLADSLPQATHFYLNFFVVQAGAAAMELLRPVPLLKYCIFKRIYEPETARELAEPEDQDYNGMGSRSARLAMLLVTALVFCTLSPLITILAFAHFALRRLVYGYLFVYAETPKPDLGGTFWCTQLKHVQQGLVLYIVVMTGVLLKRASSPIPAVVAGSSFVYWAISYNGFRRILRWETLPFEEIAKADVFAGGADQPRVPVGGMCYKQPELPPPDVKVTKVEPKRPWHVFGAC